jgi:hypothetical protein
METTFKCRLIAYFEIVMFWLVLIKPAEYIMNNDHVFIDAEED